MNQKIKSIGAIILGCLSCFTYGGYVYGTVNCGKIVEPHQWFLTGIFGITFLIYGILTLNKEQNEG